MKKNSTTSKAFTLIELLIVIGIIAILAAAVIVAINPGRQFAQARDATRENHLTTLYNSLMSYKVDNLGVLTDLNLPEELTEICNTNLPDPDCGDMFNLSQLVDENYINQLPVDPQATGYGTGYQIAQSSIILLAPNAETRFIGRGITEAQYAGGGTENGFESCGDDVTFMYDGESVTYGTVIGQNDTCWMDRNLGASQVATAYDDQDAYGDLFQWGRLADGHQKRDADTVEDQEGDPKNSNNPGHNKFIYGNGLSSDGDWRDPKNDDLWQGESGTNNPCPDDWRVPTVYELEDEIESWISENYNGAFDSDLRWTTAGRREWFDGSLDTGSWGFYWSSSSFGYPDVLFMTFDDVVGFTTDEPRGYGFSVRCIKG